MTLAISPHGLVAHRSDGYQEYRKRRSGRPEASSEIRALIRKMAAADPLWGAPRIHGELLKLGIDISERTVLSTRAQKSQTPF